MVCRVTIPRKQPAAVAPTLDSRDEPGGAPGRLGRTAGKGRPTPKRRDAQAQHRGPAGAPPRTQREARALARKNQANRAAVPDRRARMLAGDDRSLPPRDRGPVKAFARDMVDSRRNLAGVLMPLAGLTFVSLVPTFAQWHNQINLFVVIMLVAAGAQSVLLGVRVTKEARRRFPNQPINGLVLGCYVFLRSSQIRMLRVPKTRVRRGDDKP